MCAGKSFECRKNAVPSLFCWDVGGYLCGGLYLWTPSGQHGREGRKSESGAVTHVADQMEVLGVDDDHTVWSRWQYASISQNKAGLRSCRRREGIGRGLLGSVPKCAAFCLGGVSVLQYNGMYGWVIV